MIVSLEKPGSPEELVHVGVKGMKWGVHRSKGTQDFKKKFNTANKRKTEINRARASVDKTKSAYKNEKDPTKRAKLKAVHLKNPDAATALRLTRGEKIVAGLLYTAVPIPVVPVGVAAVTAVRVGRRRALEK